MSEKKNIVIKVKYPTSGKAPNKPTSASGVITEWNIKRLALAIGSVLLIMLSLFYFGGDNGQENDATATQLALPEQPPENNNPSGKEDVASTKKPSLDKPKQVSVNTVVRAQLTHELEKNEPIDNVPLPLKIGKKETIGLYYFVELKGMKGKVVFHEWLLNGNLVSRKKVNISADPWRTASKQVISYTTNNDWMVRLVDESGNKLNEKSFNLDLK